MLEEVRYIERATVKNATDRRIKKFQTLFRKIAKVLKRTLRFAFFKTLDVVTVFASASLPRALMPALPLVVLALAASFALALALARAVALAPPLRPRFGAPAVALAGWGGGFIAPPSTRASKSFRPLTDFPFRGAGSVVVTVPGKIVILSFDHDSVEPTQHIVMHSA